MLLQLLLVIEVIVALFLIVVVLLQRSEGGGLVTGGSGSLMSVRGAGDLLTRTTWILATIFFVLALVLTIVAGRQKGASSVADRLKIDAVDPNSLKQAPVQAPAPGQPVTIPGSQPAGPLQAPTPSLGNPFGAPAPAASTPAQPTPAAPPAK